MESAVTKKPRWSPNEQNSFLVFSNSPESREEHTLNEHGGIQRGVEEDANPNQLPDALNLEARSSEVDRGSLNKSSGADIYKESEVDDQNVPKFKTDEIVRDNDNPSV